MSLSTKKSVSVWKRPPTDQKTLRCNGLVARCFTKGVWGLITSFLLCQDDFMLMDNLILTALAAINKQCAANVRAVSISQARIALTFVSKDPTKETWDKVCAKYPCRSVRYLILVLQPSGFPFQLHLETHFPLLQTLFLDSEHVDL